jgi:hypothetical protein
MDSALLWNASLVILRYQPKKLGGFEDLPGFARLGLGKAPSPHELCYPRNFMNWLDCASNPGKTVCKSLLPR